MAVEEADNGGFLEGVGSECKFLFTPDLLNNRLNEEGRYWSAKPDQKKDVPTITRRLESARPMEVTASRFCKFVQMGGTYTGALFEPTTGKEWGKFEGMQLFGVDFDNTDEQHRPLKPGAPGYLDPVDALERAYSEGLPPVCLYFTFNARPENIRYRIVFATPEPVGTEEDAKAVIRSLMQVFPECDPACKNPNRLFYGSNGEVWPCWAMRHPFDEEAPEDAKEVM